MLLSASPGCERFQTLDVQEQSGHTVYLTHCLANGFDDSANLAGFLGGSLVPPYESLFGRNLLAWNFRDRDHPLRSRWRRRHRRCHRHQFLLRPVNLIDPHRLDRIDGRSPPRRQERRDRRNHRQDCHRSRQGVRIQRTHFKQCRSKQPVHPHGQNKPDDNSRGEQSRCAGQHQTHDSRPVRTQRESLTPISLDLAVTISAIRLYNPTEASSIAAIANNPRNRILSRGCSSASSKTVSSIFTPNTARFGATS